jgi:hypothetical protein
VQQLVTLPGEIFAFLGFGHGVGAGCTGTGTLPACTLRACESPHTAVCTTTRNPNLHLTAAINALPLTVIVAVC